MESLKIWTDGSYRPSTDMGGIGVVVINDDGVFIRISGRMHHTTNNQMEVGAIIKALEYINFPLNSVTIYTDSQYCLGIINKYWKRNKNKEWWDLFDKRLAAVKEKFCSNIEFVYTKGHDTDELNNLADALATSASISGPIITFDLENPIQTMTIALDFDGTVVKHRYPDIGEDIGAVPVLQALQNNGHQLILFTMRDNCSHGRNCLKEALAWFSKNQIELTGVNCNPWQKSWTNSPKVFASMYIDDAALGAPLKQGELDDRPYIDWKKCVDLFVEYKMLTEDQKTELLPLIP